MTRTCLARGCNTESYRIAPAVYLRSERATARYCLPCFIQSAAYALSYKYATRGYESRLVELRRGLSRTRVRLKEFAYLPVKKSLVTQIDFTARAQRASARVSSIISFYFPVARFMRDRLSRISIGRQSPRGCRRAGVTYPSGAVPRSAYKLHHVALC